jgi:hypothetical protein
MAHNEQLLINGNWNQTIAYLLEHLQELTVSGITDTQQVITILNDLNAALAECCETTVSATTVTVTDVVTLSPKVIEVIEYIRGIQQPPIIQYQTNYITPPPIIKTTVVNLNHWATSAYGMLCGTTNPNDFIKQGCIKCVDQWMKDNPETRPTKNNGCKCGAKPNKTKCQLEADACIKYKRRRMR